MFPSLRWKLICDGHAHQLPKSFINHSPLTMETDFFTSIASSAYFQYQRWKAE